MAAIAVVGGDPNDWDYTTVDALSRLEQNMFGLNQANMDAWRRLADPTCCSAKQTCTPTLHSSPAQHGNYVFLHPRKKRSLKFHPDTTLQHSRQQALRFSLTCRRRSRSQPPGKLLLPRFGLHVRVSTNNSLYSTQSVVTAVFQEASGRRPVCSNSFNPQVIHGLH